MISGAATTSQLAILQVYPAPDQDHDHNSTPTTTHADHQSTTFLYSLSILKEKVHLVQSTADIVFNPPPPHQHQTQSSVAFATMNSLLQEIIMLSSSMMFTCQEMTSLGPTPGNNINPTTTTNNTTTDHHHGGRDQFMHHQVSKLPAEDHGQESVQPFYSSNQLDNWYGIENYNTNGKVGISSIEINHELGSQSQHNNNNINNNMGNNNFDIIELNAADLLAKYTHYCQICGKGFKRDANLRMHMRAHGDEYKTSAALINPMKSKGISTSNYSTSTNQNNNNNVMPGQNEECSANFPRKYSCPQEGCRWNQKHAKFQPLKSMICVKNHYKRSHCPKMYICKRCNSKQFSVLSDLRTHEKHCGDLKWLCSCGTTFSRKDKLMGHVALFVGHSPVVNSMVKPEHQDHH